MFAFLQLIHIADSGKGSDEGPEVIEVPVWNGTVANLTLMALGSSAPEILLSIIEIAGNGYVFSFTFVDLVNFNFMIFFVFTGSRPAS